MVITRAVAGVSAILALLVSAWLESRAWSPLLPLSLVVAGVAFAAARYRPPAAYAAVMILGCVSPVLLNTLGYFSPSPWTPWLAAVLAVALARDVRDEWALPWPWTLPLVFWVLVVACAWPIVVAREFDFDPGLLGARGVGVTGQGVPPAVHAVWIAGVAATQLAGFLWLDLLFRTFRGRPEAFERQVAWPMVIGVAASAAVAIYQWSVDMTFLNATVFAGLQRAVGTMFDANAHGTAVALAMGAVVALAPRLPPIWRVPLVAVALCTFFLAVWASASRSALLVALASIAGAGWLWLMVPGRTRLARRILAVPLLVVAILLAARVARPPELEEGQRAVGPIQRTFDKVFARGRHDLGEAIQEVMRRDGYGPIADRMIEEHPISGIGIGSFHALSLDYGPRVGEDVPSDNAQNWVRHQAAENGVLGSLGWLVWLPMWMAAMVARPRAGDPLVPRLIVFPIVGLLVASLFGLPTQNPVLLVMFWTLVFWHAAASGRPAQADPPRRAPWPAWAALIGAVALHAGATFVAARGTLRVPERAASFGWPYRARFDVLDASGGLEPFRWSGKSGTISIPVTGSYLRLKYWVHHPDAAQRPVHVILKIGGSTVVDERLDSHEPRTVYVRLLRNAVLDARVDRVWTPGNEAVPRAIGVAIAEWRFVPAPPEGARVITPGND